MRLFEDFALFTMLLILAWSFVSENRRSRIILYAPLLTWALLGFHFIFEGARWQMIPAYLLAAGLTINNYSLLKGKRKARELNRLVRLGIVLFFLVVFFFIYQIPRLFPVFTLPEPGGPYAVGSAGTVLIDAERDEPFTADPSDRREVPVRVWYPAEPAVKAKPEGYWTDHPEYSRYLTEELGLPAFSLDHLKLVKTHSYSDALLAPGQENYPVILFQHGYRLGYLEQNTSLMETLASHGYVVISLAHPYEAIAAPLSDGRTARYDGTTKDGFMGSAAKQEVSLEIWASDTVFVLDTLETLRASDPLGFLAGRLDMEHLGIMGMSFGGSTASLVCLRDEHCTAGLTLDSPQYSAVMSGQLEQPFLFMVSASGEYLERDVYEKASGPIYLVTVEGAEHYNFTDLTLVSPLGQAFNFSGPIAGDQMMRIMNTYTLAFFDKHLKDIGAPVLNGATAEYPEVTIESRNTR